MFRFGGILVGGQLDRANSIVGFLQFYNQPTVGYSNEVLERLLN